MCFGVIRLSCMTPLMKGSTLQDVSALLCELCNCCLMHSVQRVLGFDEKLYRSQSLLQRRLKCLNLLDGYVRMCPGFLYSSSHCWTLPDFHFFFFLFFCQFHCLCLMFDFCHQMLTALQMFGANLNDYLHMLLPPIVKLFDSSDIPFPVRKSVKWKWQLFYSLR